MATLVMSPAYEYGSFKSSTQKGHSFQGRKSPVNNNIRRNLSTSTKPASPPHSRASQQHQHHPQQEQQQPSSPNAKTSPESPTRKLERAISEPGERRGSPSSPPANTTGNNSGGSNSSRYKTELCRPFEESGTCKYGDKCQFAHGMKELRSLARHPKYKTELCRSFHTTGLCPYGPRCHFIHNSDQTKATILSALSTTRPKAQSSSSVGSSGDGSPPPSQTGSPTQLGSSEDFFEYSSSQTAFPFPPLESMQRSTGYMEYTTHEFNPDYYDTPSIFQERILSSVLGSPVTVAPSDGLDLDLCGSPPALELFPTSPTSSPPGFGSFPVFNLFAKDH